jgi:hypothetical protein
VHGESLSVIVQRDATVYSFIIFSADSSACFAWYPRPSSEAHSNCNYNIRHWSNRICYRQLMWRSRNSEWTVANTDRPVPDVIITVWMCSWWWTRVSSKTCRAVCRKYNKTVYSRISLDNYWHTSSILSVPLEDGTSRSSCNVSNNYQRTLHEIS